MELLSIQNIVDFLQNEFKELEAELIEDLLLKKHCKTNDDIDELKRNIPISALPADFVQLICDFDFGNFSIQNVQFGYDEDYFERLAELNNENNYWFNDAKKAGVLIIANSDPFTILLAENGTIYGVSPEVSFEKKLKIANSFTHFIQGLGTSFKAKRQNPQKEFLTFAENEFGNDALKFWKYRI